MRELYYLFVILLVNIGADMGLYAQNEIGTNNDFNEVLSLIDSARNKRYLLESRKLYIDRAYKLAQNEKNDSIRNRYFLELSLTYGLHLNDSVAFRELNRLSTELSRTLKDSISLANNFWDLGTYYSYKNIRDSSYYMYFEAKKIFEAKKDTLHTGQMLLNMAIIQQKLKDFTGSEITTIAALKILKPLNEYRLLYKCYNNLGVIFDDLGEYEQALLYHNEALQYVEKIEEENTLKENTLNNIGVVYQNMKNYEMALTYFEKASENKNYTSDLKVLARTLDNIAYCKFKLGDSLQAYSLFIRALHIRDSIKDYPGYTLNRLHLAEYYLSKKDTQQAIQEAIDAEKIASKHNILDNQLLSLKFLAEVSENYSYAREYIILSNRLVKEERVVRNKFARIRFETDEFIEKTEKLSEQKKIILLSSGALLLIGSLLFIIKNQQARNKELKYEQAQQKANEEIYNLMLTQQYKLDEGRRKEKKRISEELHDGVLGKLFGTRLILGTLNRAGDDESVAKKEKYIKDLQEIEEEIRNVSHELNEQSQLGNIGYTSLIENLLETQSQISKFQYELRNDTNIKWEEIEGSLKMNLYRILQEAIQNINKYAKATNVWVSFKLNANFLRLIIKDDGEGFDLESKAKGIGLKNIRSRVKTITGEVKIITKPKAGTEIIIEVPL